MKKWIEPDKLRIDELNIQQRQNPSSVNQLVAQIHDLQDKVNCLNDEKEFYDPETASSSGIFHVPSQPLSIPSLRPMISRDSCLPHDTRNSMDTSENVFEKTTCSRRPSSVFFENPKNLPPSSSGLRPGNTGNILKHGQAVRREPQSSTIPIPRFTTNHETWAPSIRTGGTYSQNCMMEAPR